jgi:hypothetical protein
MLPAQTEGSSTAIAGTALVEDGFVKPVWVLSETRDRAGNAVFYHYEVESEAQAPYSFEYRIHSIEYTARRNGSGNIEEPARREVVFEYSTVAERPDQLFTYTSGVRQRVSRRLAWIKRYAPNLVAKEFVGGYAIAYESGPTQEKSFVESVTRYDRDYARLWSRRFEWQHAPEIEFDVHDVVTGTYAGQHSAGPLVVDLDNDGRAEMIWADHVYRTAPGNAVPYGISMPNPGYYGRPADVDGDSKIEILKTAGNQRVFKKWNDATGTFDPTPFTLANTSVEFGDTDGDGRAELHTGWSPLDDPPAEGSPFGGDHWRHYALGTSDGGTVVHRATLPEGPGPPKSSQK